MIITCLQCNTQYYLANQSLAPNGKKLKCSKCSAIWFQEYVAASKIVFDKAKVKNNKIFLPAVIKSKLLIWQPMFAIVLFFIILGLTAIFFQESLSIKYPTISSMYDKLGIPSVNGMKVSSIEILGKNDNYMDINAVIENNSKFHKRVPSAVIFLFGEDYALLKTILIPAPPKYLNSLSKYAFYKKIKYDFKVKPKIISITLINGIEVFLHSLNFK